MKIEIQTPESAELLKQMSDDIKNKLADWTCHNTGGPAPVWAMQAAENPLTPGSILSMLAESGNREVRIAVANNNNTLLETKIMLVKDEITQLRYQLAENHNFNEGV